MDLHQPHDKFFKFSLTQKQVAIDFLRSNLDPEIFKLIDCNTLALIDESFVLPDLQEIHSDLIYRCQFQQKPGYIYFYILFEYNSTPEKLTAFYIQYYVMKLMHACIQQGQKKLPIVLPIYIYHGSQSPIHTVETSDTCN